MSRNRQAIHHHPGVGMFCFYFKMVLKFSCSEHRRLRRIFSNMICFLFTFRFGFKESFKLFANLSNTPEEPVAPQSFASLLRQSSLIQVSCYA